MKKYDKGPKTMEIAYVATHIFFLVHSLGDKWNNPVFLNRRTLAIFSISFTGLLRGVELGHHVYAKSP